MPVIPEMFSDSEESNTKKITLYGTRLKFKVLT